jgi:sugar lactone lactonase YvrE
MPPTNTNGNANVNANANANANVNANDNVPANTNTNANANVNANANTNLNDNAAGLDPNLAEAQGMIFSPDGNLLVASRNSAQVREYDGETGDFIGVFIEGPELQEPFGLHYGPDGLLYVTDRTVSQVLRYNAASGAFVDVFAEFPEGAFPIDLLFTPPASESFVLEPDAPVGSEVTLRVTIEGLEHGGARLLPAGGAYAPGTSVEILVRPVSSGAFVGFAGDIDDAVIEAGDGDDVIATVVMTADREVTVTFTAAMFVSSFNNDVLYRVHPDTGEILEELRAGLTPLGIALDPNGDILIANRIANVVQRYRFEINNTEAFAAGETLYSPRYMTIGPNGNLFVVVSNDPNTQERDSEHVLEINPTTGAIIGVFTQGDHLSEPRGIAFGPDGDLFVSNRDTNNIIRYDGQTGAFKGVFVQGVAP